MTRLTKDFLFKIEILIPIEGESCFDAAHIKLVAEVEELGESCSLLADKVRFREKAKKQSTEDMNIIKTKLDKLEKRQSVHRCQVFKHSMKVALVEAARLDLMASKEKLEEDIRVKKNSIAIDQVAIRLHKNCKPGKFVLCTYKQGKDYQ